jgi:NADH:ubiquinone oxidoreductase subunit K
MIEADPILAVSGLLFAIGLIGAILRRHMIAILLCIQLMLAASSVALIGFARLEAGGGGALGADPQVFALLIVIASAAEIVVGLAIGMAFVRSRQSLDVDQASEMRW